MLRLLLIILLFSNGFCSKAQFIKPPKLVTSLREKLVQITPNRIMERSVYYIGKLKDTIHYERLEDLRIPIGKNSAIIDSSPNNLYQNASAKNTDLFIDFKQEVILSEYTWYDKISQKWIYIKAFPAFLRNKSDSTIIIGYNYHVPIFIELQNERKEWVPFESPNYVYDCGVGMTHILLPPNEIACVFIPKYKLNHKKTGRLNINGATSQKFVVN